MANADYYIQKLELISHVEGGAFKETYRSALSLSQKHLPAEFRGDRNASTAIYFLLKHRQFSALHKIAADELWHFYDGDALCIYEITVNGELKKHLLGKNLENGESFQCLIKAGSWFGSRCEVADGFSLVGCTVAPGFDFDDFILAERMELCEAYPQHRHLINELTTDNIISFSPPSIHL
ncbi:MAG: cupin domain-containing protein [Bacteroidota bacterium]